MKEIKVIREIPPRMREVRVLNERSMTDMDEGLIEGSEDLENGHLPVYHKAPEDIEPLFPTEEAFRVRDDALETSTRSEESEQTSPGNKKRLRFSR